MSKRIFSGDQIKELLQNPNVKKCSKRSITYDQRFKITAVRDWQSGLSPQEIFAQAGFGIKLIGDETPKNCLGRWRKIFKEKGSQGLSAETRGQSGGRPKKNWQNDKEKIKYLEATVAYLKVENDFLAKLRKKS